MCFSLLLSSLGYYNGFEKKIVKLVDGQGLLRYYSSFVPGWAEDFVLEILTAFSPAVQ
jgi:hypothetical protein